MAALAQWKGYQKGMELTVWLQNLPGPDAIRVRETTGSMSQAGSSNMEDQEATSTTNGTVRKRSNQNMPKSHQKLRRLQQDCPTCRRQYKCTLVHHYVLKHSDVEVLVDMPEKRLKVVDMDDKTEVAWPACCGVCGTLVQSKESLYDHVSSHTGEYRYRCRLCSYLACNPFFITGRHGAKVHKGHEDLVEMLDDEVVSEFDGTAYMCTECGFYQLNRANLKSHIDAKHPTGGVALVSVVLSEQESVAGRQPESISQQLQQRPDATKVTRAKKQSGKPQKETTPSTEANCWGDENDGRTAPFRILSVVSLHPDASVPAGTSPAVASPPTSTTSAAPGPSPLVALPLQPEFCPGWLPSLKPTDSTFLNIYSASKLRRLFKCMSLKCFFTTDIWKSFLCHLNAHCGGRQLDVSLPLERVMELVLRCSYCEHVAVTTRDLVDHVVQEHGPSRYQCSRCFYRSLSKDFMSLHQQERHGLASDKIGWFQVPVLPFVPNPEKPRLSPKFNELTLNYKCMECDCEYGAFDSRKFKMHLETEHGECSAYKCYICDSAHSDVDILMQHYKIHGFREYYCFYCGDSFDLLNKMNAHMRECHPSRPDKVVVRTAKVRESGGIGQPAVNNKVIVVDDSDVDVQ